MSFGNLIISTSWAALGTAGLGLAGLLIWWLRRKRQRRVWLPTMRVMRLEPRILPRIVFRLPPLLGFICFAISALVLLGFSLKPRSEVFTPFDPNQARIHIFCDMSPSVAAHVTIEEYATHIAGLYESLKGTGRISLSTSHSAKIIQPENAEAAAQVLRGLGFQRAGVRLGSAIKQMVNAGLEANRLFIVSDRDQHSWTDLNWRYLLDEMDVVYYELARASQTKSNVFINDARFLSSPALLTMDWDVEIMRRGSEDAAQGRLTATFMGHELAAVPWKIAAGKQRLNVRMSWPASTVAEIDVSAARDVPLVFRLETEGADALAADNAYRTEIKGIKQEVLLISESGGERLLEDPAAELSVSLAIQGFSVRRYDYLGDNSIDLNEFPLIIAMGGLGNDHFCPRAVLSGRQSRRARRSTEDARRNHSRPLPKVWLAPARLDADYKQLCECYVSLQMAPEGVTPATDLCSQVASREQWTQALNAMGAKPVGGSFGNQKQVLAYAQRNQTSGLEVLSFTVPLMPLMATGINHAAMPIMIKEVLTWQGIIAAQGPQQANWPRVDDYATSAWETSGPKDSDVLSRIRLSNVPIGESLLTEIDPVNLPQRWSAEKDTVGKQLPAKKDREDPLPWLKLAALICLGAMGLEGMWTVGARVLRFMKQRPQVASVLLVTLIASTNAIGAVEIALLAPRGGRASFATLAREVSQRTSIEVDVKPNIYPQVSPEAAAEPWLWTDNLQAITTKAGLLQPELALWLKRGGLLILESPWQPAQLETMVSRLDPGAGASGANSWRPLPPDHELMRSFYLLDALPSCNGEIWRGYQFDGRLAILAVPYGFLESLRDQSVPITCANPPDQERSARIFVNMIMVALATDYKRDQIHLPEILKRLR